MQHKLGRLPYKGAGLIFIIGFRSGHNGTTSDSGLFGRFHFWGHIMELAVFIRKNQEAIVTEWEAFASTCTLAASHMNRAALRDHIIELLNFIAKDLESSQTEGQQSEKSKGRGPQSEGAAEAHGGQRFDEGFDTLEMLSEFRALRASVVKLWMTEDQSGGTSDDFIDLVRFNESIDQAMTESLNRFTEKEMRARSLFLGTLVHDFRTPLNAISMSAQILLIKGHLSSEDAQLATQIENSAANISHLVSDMIDTVRIRLGKALPLAPAPMDMGIAIKEAAKEMQAANPDHKITIETTGDLQGSWDSVRIRQVLSNLMGNAIQHGVKASGVHITAKGAGDEIILTVHNEGAIPADSIAYVFQPLTRGKDDTPQSTSLGLGLFITKGVISAHGGEISVTSDKKTGTTFTAHLPRKQSGRPSEAARRTHCVM